MFTVVVLIVVLVICGVSADPLGRYALKGLVDLMIEDWPITLAVLFAISVIGWVF